MLQQYSVDGVIVASSTLPPAFAHAFRQAGVPVVHSFGRHTSEPEVHIVGIDNRFCGRMAAEALIARGYRHIGFMGGPESATSTQDLLGIPRPADGDNSGGAQCDIAASLVTQQCPFHRAGDEPMTESARVQTIAVHR